MALDYRALLGGVEARNNQRNTQMQQFMQALQFMNQQKMQEKELALKGLDVDALLTGPLIKQQMGLPLTPEEQARMAVGDKLRTSKTAMDMFGRAYSPYQSVIGGGVMPSLAAAPDMQPPAPEGAFAEAMTAPAENMPGYSGLSPKSQEDIKKDKVIQDYKNTNPKEYTAEQLKAASFANRMSESSKMLEQLVAENPEAEKAKTGNMGYAASIVSALPFGLGDSSAEGLVKASATPEQQQYLNAAQEWIRAKLRKESGAVIGPQEMIDEYKTYFPVAGDSAKVIAQKNKLRTTAETSLQNESAGAYKLQYGTPQKQPAQPSADPMAAKRARLEELRRMKAARGGQ